MINKKTIFRIILCGVLLSLSSIAHAGQHNHLEPLPLTRSGYEMALFNSLLEGESPHLYMVILPSVKSTQSAVIIDQIVEFEEYSDENVSVPDWEPKIKSSQWILKYTVFKHLLMPKYPFDPLQTYNVDLTNDIERLEININDKFASLMTKAWLHVLRETRYPAEWKPQTVLDGSTYIFKCDGDRFDRYYGMTSSSSDVELDKLGVMLISLVKADEHDRELLQKKCVELASNIIKKKHPNQRVKPTVKTPVESGNEQGTASYP